MKSLVFFGDNLVNTQSWSRERKVLLEAMAERGLREETVTMLQANLQTASQLKLAKPKVVVAFGDKALRLLVDSDPDSVLSTRGYVFDSKWGFPVLATVPLDTVASVWTPWRVLLSLDLQRAKDMVRKGWSRPQRNVEVLV